MKSPKGIFSPAPAGLPPVSLKRLARTAGAFYLVVAIAGGFAVGFLDPLLYAAGDPAATAGNVVENAGLLRIGVVAHLINNAFLLLTAATLYLLLKHAGKHPGRLMILAVIVAAGIDSFGAVFAHAALLVATDGSYQAAFGLLGSNALVLLLLNIQHYAVLAAQVFFGLWLAPLGYLAIKSRLFPKVLGLILILATASYLTDVAFAFLLPEVGKQIHNYLSIVPLVAEVWMLFYLLIVGVRTPDRRPDARAGGTTPRPNSRLPDSRITIALPPWTFSPSPAVAATDVPPAVHPRCKGDVMTSLKEHRRASGAGKMRQPSSQPSGFQGLLAAGAPWVAAAYGGTNSGVLPRTLRVSSTVAAAVYAALAGMAGTRLAPTSFRRRFMYGTSALMALQAIMNVASPSNTSSGPR